jgi:hypothetical protein
MMSNDDHNQRGSKSETEPSSLMDDHRAATLGPSRSMLSLPSTSMANAGAVGAGSVMERLLSMMSTDAIPGRSCGSSWTQSRPTWTHLSTSCGCRPSARQLSSSSRTLPRLQCLHTCVGQGMISNFVYVRGENNCNWCSIILVATYKAKQIFRRT